MLAPHRGIVDSDTWLACRRKCLEHRRAGPKGTEKSSWLVGKVACGICGSSLAVRKKGEGGTRYFVCGGRIRHNGCEGLGTIRARELEEFIYQRIVEKLRRTPAVSAEDAGRKEADNRILLQKLELERQIEELTSQAAGAGKALMGYLSQKAEELERKKYSLEKNLEHKTTLKRGKTPQSLAEALTVWNKFSNQEKSLVADSVIEKITIFKDKAELSWRY